MTHSHSFISISRLFSFYFIPYYSASLHYSTSTASGFFQATNMNATKKNDFMRKLQLVQKKVMGESQNIGVYSHCWERERAQRLGACGRTVVDD